MKEGVTISFEGATIYNNGGTINGDIINPTYYSSTTPHDGLPRMPHLLNRKQATMLCQMLMNEGFLDRGNNTENFCAVMGCIDVDVEKLVPIVWTANVQHLREMLESVYLSLLDSKALTKSEIERRVCMCFVDPEGKPLALAKPKKKSDEDPKTRALARILATFQETILNN